LWSGAAASIAPLLAACGAGGAQGPAQQAMKPVTLTYMTDWTGGARGEATKQSIAAYQAQFPHVTLELQGVTGDLLEAQTANLAGGTLASVLYFSPNWFEQWVEKGLLADVTPWLKKLRFEKSDYFWDARAMEYKGKTYTLPYHLGAGVWVYNQTWFERAGVAPPTDAWTTEDFLAAGRALTKAGENQWGIEMLSTALQAWPWIYAQGLDLVDLTGPVRKTTLDQPKQREVFQYAYDLVQRYQVAPVVEGKNAVKGLSFPAGNLAMHAQNAPKTLKDSIKDQFKWGVMPTPRWAGNKKRSTNSNHAPLTISKLGEQRGHAEAAAQFIIWMAGEGGQTIVAKTGAAVPVHKKTAYSPVYLDGAVPTLKTELDMLETKPDQLPRGRPVFREFIPWYDALTGVTKQGFGGEISFGDMIAKATQAADAAIKQGVS
jgi:multiple sugar transport system substrate-binding protein